MSTFETSPTTIIFRFGGIVAKMGSRKTGIPTMMLVARRLCGLVTRFTPIIAGLFPSNTALLTALAAANAACETLYAELQEVREYGD